VTKAILLLGPDDVAMEPAVLCADTLEEAKRDGMPLLGEIIAQLSGGKQILANGDAGYALYDEGRRVASLEIFETPGVAAEPGIQP
jgi:hypothetical protein